MDSHIVVSNVQCDFYLTHMFIWGSAVGGSGAALAVCSTLLSTTGWQLNVDLHDIFSFTREEKTQLLSRWWSQELNALEKTPPHPNRKTPKYIALLFVKDSMFEYPSLTLVCTVNRQLNHHDHPFLHLERHMVHGLCHCFLITATCLFT